MAREHAFNVFVIDDRDQPLSDAHVVVLLDGKPVTTATTGDGVAATGVIRGLPNAPITVELPEEVGQVSVRVTHANQVQEQPVDLDAPNLTFRFGRTDKDPGADRSLWGYVIAPPGRGSTESEAKSRKTKAQEFDVVALRTGMVDEFNREDLAVLCKDLGARLKTERRQRFSLDDLPSGGKEFQVAELIDYFQRRRTLPMLLEVVERARPGFGVRVGGAAMRGLEAAPRPSPRPPAASRLPTVTPKIRLAEVPTSIYELLPEDKWPLVSVEIANGQATGFDGWLIVELSRFSDKDVRPVTIEPGGTVEIDFHPVLDPAAIDRLEDIERATLHLQLDIEGNHTVSRQTKSLYLLPRTAAPLSVKDLMTGEWQDLRPYLVSYVTPNADGVQAFLANVTRFAPPHGLIGYVGKPGDVEPQLRAVFEAVKELGVRYAHSRFVFKQHEVWSKQQLRLPRQTLVDKVANCLDGAVLVASLLESFGLSAALVFTGANDNVHAFVGCETAPGSDTWLHLETTGFTTMMFEEARRSADERASAFDSERAASGSPIFLRLPLRTLRE